jgi:hypothetical protein
MLEEGSQSSTASNTGGGSQELSHHHMCLIGLHFRGWLSRWDLRCTGTGFLCIANLVCFGVSVDLGIHHNPFQERLENGFKGAPMRCPII